MRPLLAIAFALAACGTAPPPSPSDAAPDTVAPDAPPADVAPPDALEEAPAPDAAPDAVLQDASPEVQEPMDAAPDAAPDAAVDVDPRQSEVCRAVNATCDGRRVNVQTGERDGGITYHCGGCGITCPAGSFCVACVCER